MTIIQKKNFYLINLFLKKSILNFLIENFLAHAVEK